MNTLLCYCLALASLPAFAQTRLPAPRPSAQDAHVYDVTENANALTLTYSAPSARAPHGLLTAGWTRPTKAAAAPANFTVVVTSAQGKPLQRTQTSGLQAEPLDLGGTLLYPQSVRVPLAQTPTTGTRVAVLDQAAGKRYEFLLRP